MVIWGWEEVGLGGLTGAQTKKIWTGQKSASTPRVWSAGLVWSGG